jgi:hypothetical protein
MAGRIVWRKAYDGGDYLNAFRRAGVGAEEIMLGKRANKAVATEQESEGLDDGGLAAVIGADQNAEIAERDFSGPDATESLHFQLCQLHFLCNPPFRAL